jgi:peptide/nickel transport system permease protein
MNWWQKLSKNPIARLGAIILIFFYGVAICADFVAPYDPYIAQANGSLLPPTQMHWQHQDKFIGLHVYPTTQGKTDVATGDRFLVIDTQKPFLPSLFLCRRRSKNSKYSPASKLTGISLGLTAKAS